MTLPDITKENLGNKKVLMRVDFNVEFENGNPKEKYKIESVKKTVDFVQSQKGAKLALLSHMGRPNGLGKAEMSFKDLTESIAGVLGKELVFVSDCIGDVVGSSLDALEDGQILLLENPRFYKAEISGEKDFAESLAKNFDVYVNEAFSTSHRNHGSITKIAEILPSFAGVNLLKEVEVLSGLRESFEKPAVAIIGGAKVETKIPVIEFFAKNYDKVLVGGRIGIEIKEKGIVVQNNVVLPEDYAGQGLDIGPKTIKVFSDLLMGAKTIVWNGPLGKFENPEFAKGTDGVLDAINQNETAYKVAGGGETVQLLGEKGFIEKFDFVSTGGGAMLEFLAKGTLSGLEVLNNFTRYDI
ncbi:MAG: phosphoglycerate kinase [Patescibacteria group bacterium]